MNEHGALLNSYALGLSLLLGITLNSYQEFTMTYCQDQVGKQN